MKTSYAKIIKKVETSATNAGDGKCSRDAVWSGSWCRKLNMLGIYMQRSWIITGVTALILTLIYTFTSPILKFIRQSKWLEVDQLEIE
ncbi:hypothetical protein FRX31_034694 [Thalictrum thalictroides]|uniref:Uncharacterized protein n=1 Tax=Thalictrum thalictroides TaxID=46969 RepID=A0A7J6UU66_THATH|nr:hypothetical protein FRX31_034694 [Thalictrum thalictroides]